MSYYERYINPFTDFGFKKIFGDPNDTSLLKSLINDILGFEGQDQIATIIFKNGELLPDSPEDRKAIFDLYCTDEKGSEFIVELQKVYQEHFQSRALYYATFPIQEQAIRGKWDFSLTPIYFIGLLNFEVATFKHRPHYLHHGKITDIYSKDVMYNNLNMIYVEIPKLRKDKGELSTHLEWWIYVFQNLNQLQDIPEALKGDVIEKAFERAEFIKLPKLERDKYHKNLKVYRDLINSLDTAFNQGVEKGIQKGIEQEKLELAKKLLDILDNETIALKTGLAVEVIESLRG